jgi:hypothetical protein
MSRIRDGTTSTSTMYTKEQSIIDIDVDVGRAADRLINTS